LPVRVSCGPVADAAAARRRGITVGARHPDGSARVPRVVNRGMRGARALVPAGHSLARSLAARLGTVDLADGDGEGRVGQPFQADSGGCKSLRIPLSGWTA